MTYDGIGIMAPSALAREAPTTQHGARREDCCGILHAAFGDAAGDCLDAPDWIAQGSSMSAFWLVGPSRERLAELGE